MKQTASFFSSALWRILIVALVILFVGVPLVLVLTSQFAYFLVRVEPQEVGVQFQGGQIKDIVGPGVYSDFGLYVELRKVSSQAIPFNVRDEEIIHVLRLLKMDTVVKHIGGLDVERDWDGTLGLGEQAALAVARVLLAEPEFVFLDRMSIAMDTTQADQMLKLFTERKITYLVLGKPDDQLGHFDAALNLATDGSWTWRTVQN